MNMKKGLASVLAASMLLTALPVQTKADTVGPEVQLLQSDYTETVPAKTVQTASANTFDAQTTAEAVVLYSGTCGERLTWTLDDQGTLTISGSGKMSDYTYFATPEWHDYCGQITTVRIEAGVTSIGSFAFVDCGNMTKVIIPDGVTGIGRSAFLYCRKLTDMTLPSTVTDIGIAAFSDCESLTEVTLPSGMTTIASLAFSGCSSLTYIRIPSSVRTIESFAFDGCSSLPTIDLPSGITAIEDCLFRGCTSLTDIEIPSGVTRIDPVAFSGCSALTEITIPSGVTDIGYDAFADCSALRKIRFTGHAPQHIGADVFAKVTATVYYPADDDTWTNEIKWERLGPGAVLTWEAVCTTHDYDTSTGICTHCGKKNPLFVPAHIASGWCGYNRWRLTSDGVLTITGKDPIKNYDYDGGQTWMRHADKITSVVIADGVTGIGSGAFMGLTKLERVTFPSGGLARIGEAAFYGCTSLKEIVIPEGIYTIPAYAFKGCSSLTKVTLPQTLGAIRQGAFENCTALSYVSLPANLEIIGPWSFKGCTGLKSVDMYAARATEIREGAFKNCTSLYTVILPEHIRSLGDSAFYGIGAASFLIPETVTNVGAWCFARAGLKHIHFDGDAPTIGEGAFNKITLTAVYSAEKSGWTADIMQNYGGTVTWTGK